MTFTVAIHKDAAIISLVNSGKKAFVGPIDAKVGLNQHTLYNLNQYFRVGLPESIEKNLCQRVLELLKT